MLLEDMFILSLMALQMPTRLVLISNCCMPFLLMFSILMNEWMNDDDDDVRGCYDSINMYIT